MVEIAGKRRQCIVIAVTALTLTAAAYSGAPVKLDGGNVQPTDSGTLAAPAEDAESLLGADARVVENTGDLPSPPVDIIEPVDAASAPPSGYGASPSQHPQSTVVAGAFAGSVLNESFDGKTMTGFGTAIIDDDNVYLVSGKGVNGSNAIKVNYRGNSKGSERVIVNYKLPRSLQYTLNFDVNFCAGFDFRKGGKLHGLGSANPVAGGKEVSPPRWSARSMFRRQGGLQSYIYSQNMKGKYGDVVIAKNFRFQPGRYYALTLQVVLNNPVAASNGYMRIFVDGTPVIYHGNIKFRSTESLDSQISTLMFNTFHGGHAADWAPRNANGSYKVDCAYFDNFAVSPLLEVRYAPVM